MKVGRCGERDFCPSHQCLPAGCGEDLLLIYINDRGRVSSDRQERRDGPVGRRQPRLRLASAITEPFGKWFRSSKGGPARRARRVLLIDHPRRH